MTRKELIMRDDAGLCTERLLLREFRQADWQAMHLCFSDPEVLRFMPLEPLTEAQTRQVVDVSIKGRTANPPIHDFAIVSSSLHRVIGACTLAIRYDELYQAELYFLLNRDYWGQGYMTEAARAVLAYGFHELDLHRVYATCRPANRASRRVLEKLGMRREGHLRKHRWVKGAWQDSFLYAILCDEWDLC